MSTNDIKSGLSEFITSSVVNLGIGCIGVFLFSIFRRRVPLYDARRIDHIRNPNYIPGEYYLARPPRQSKSMFGWIKQVYYFTDDDIAATAGIDAVMTLRFIRWCFVYFFLCTLLAAVIILPIQITADADGLTGLASLSMASIAPKSHRLVAHVVLSYLFAFLFFAVMAALWKDNLALQARWLSNEQFAGRRLTVINKFIPKPLLTDQKLYNFYNRIFPDKVVGTALLKDVPLIQKHAELRDKYARLANHFRGKMELDFEKNHERPLFDSNCCNRRLKGQDKIAYYTNLYREENKTMAHLSKEELPIKPIGFTTFNSAVSAASAATLPLLPSSPFFSSEWAPEPREIYWKGLFMKPIVKLGNSLLMHAVHFFLVFFYIIPVAFISSIVDPQSLDKNAPWLHIYDWPEVIRSFMQGFLPALAMIIFMSILPIILTAMAKFQGVESHSQIQKYIFRKYYVFQLFNFFLIQMFSNTVMDDLEYVVSNPLEIPRLLAESIPTSTNLFLNYVMLRALSANLMDLLNIGGLIKVTLLRYISKTPEDFKGLFQTAPFSYGQLLPETLLVITVGFCLGIIQPIILPFIVIFCMTFLITHKYKFVFVHVNNFETGGQFWPLTFDRVILGMIVSQFCILGLLVLKKVPIEAACYVPLPFLTFFFWLWMKNLFEARMATAHLYSAVIVDHARKCISEEETTAIRTGHELANVTEDLAPFIMPRTCMDCPAYESYKKQHPDKVPDLGYHYETDGHVYSRKTMLLSEQPLDEEGNSKNPYWNTLVKNFKEMPLTASTELKHPNDALLEVEAEAEPLLTHDKASSPDDNTDTANGRTSKNPMHAVLDAFAHIPFADMVISLFMQYVNFEQNVEFVVNERGLTKEQEEQLAACLYRRDLQRKHQRALITSTMANKDNTNTNTNTNRYDDSNDGLGNDEENPYVPTSPSPTSRMSQLSGVIPAHPHDDDDEMFVCSVVSGAGDIDLMQKYCQCELAPKRYAVRLSKQVWYQKYLDYKKAIYLEKNQHKHSAKVADADKEPVSRSIELQQSYSQERAPSPNPSDYEEFEVRVENGDVDGDTPVTASTHKEQQPSNPENHESTESDSVQLNEADSYDY